MTRQVVIDGVVHAKLSRQLSDYRWWARCSCGWRGREMGRPAVCADEWRAHIKSVEEASDAPA